MKRISDDPFRRRCQMPDCTKHGYGIVSSRLPGPRRYLALCRDHALALPDDVVDHFHYVECLIEGCNPRLAAMFATGQTPAIRTDATFLQGMSTNGSQFDGTEYLGDHYKKVAEAQGQNVKGKVYLSGLARYPGDPHAWVSGRGDVEHVLRSRGWGAEGSVNVKAAEALGPPPSVDVAEDIVQEQMERAVEQDPSQARDLEGLREKTKDRLRPRWKKKQ